MLANKILETEIKCFPIGILSGNILGMLFYGNWLFLQRLLPKFKKITAIVQLKVFEMNYFLTILQMTIKKQKNICLPELWLAG